MTALPDGETAFSKNAAASPASTRETLLIPPVSRDGAAPRTARKTFAGGTRPLRTPRLRVHFGKDALRKPPLPASSSRISARPSPAARPILLSTGRSRSEQILSGRHHYSPRPHGRSARLFFSGPHRRAARPGRFARQKTPPERNALPQRPFGHETAVSGLSRRDAILAMREKSFALLPPRSVCFP